jgi:hypothetical protein
MTMKSRSTSKAKAKPVAGKKSAGAPHKEQAAKAGTAVASRPKSIVLSKPKGTSAQPRRGGTKVRVVNKIHSHSSLAEDRKSTKGLRLPQYNYMKPPGVMHDFQVGDAVEVYCDHEKNRDRVRGWIRGIVVQVDNKLVAVQFRSNVFLTDGWMVPDRILWYPLASEHMRPVPGKKSARREEKAIPNY